MARELTEKEYLDTMSGGMKNITDTAEVLADIWAYAESFSVRMLLSEYGFEHRLVGSVYENAAGTFQHVVLFGDRENVFVVIVVDVANREVFGHHYFDLDNKYGLEN